MTAASAPANGIAGEHGARVGGDELAVGAPVAGGVLARPADGAGADLDAQDALEARRRREPEQAAAAVGVDQEARAAGRRLRGDVGDQPRQQERVVLEEVARQEPQAQVADLLGDHVARIDGHARRRLAHQQRRAAPVVRPARAHLGAQLGEARVHGRRGDRAGGTSMVRRRPGVQEADRRLAVGARAGEVRRQLRSVAVGRGAGDAGRDVRRQPREQPRGSRRSSAPAGRRRRGAGTGSRRRFRRADRRGQPRGRGADAVG